MKKQNIYISSDIEGVSQSSHWDDGDHDCKIYQVFRTIMSVELATLIENITQPSKILLRDAHGSAKNILPSLMPKNVKLIQSWNKDPNNMMRGIDKRKFDFCCLHGYHAAGGSNLSPLAHTFSSDNFGAFHLNGQLVGETTFAALTAAYYNVPLIYLCGDAGAAAEVKKLNANIITTVTKKFAGKDPFILSTSETLEHIKADFTKAQNQFAKHPEKFKIILPEHFKLSIQYMDPEQTKLHLHKYFGRLRQTAFDTLQYETDDFHDLLSMMRLMKLKI